MQLPASEPRPEASACFGLCKDVWQTLIRSKRIRWMPEYLSEAKFAHYASRSEAQEKEKQGSVEHTSVVSFAVRLPREGRLGRETLGSEGTVTPDKGDDAAAAAAAKTMRPLNSRHTQHDMAATFSFSTNVPIGTQCRIRQYLRTLYLSYQCLKSSLILAQQRIAAPWPSGHEQPACK